MKFSKYKDGDIVIVKAVGKITEDSWVEIGKEYYCTVMFESNSEDDSIGCLLSDTTSAYIIIGRQCAHLLEGTYWKIINHFKPITQ